MRQEAIDKGVLTVLANTEVLDLEVDDGAISAVVTDNGRIVAEHAIACGVETADHRPWRGRDDPVDAGGHQMVKRRADQYLGRDEPRRSPSRSSATWTRSATTQSAGSMEVGSYAHRPRQFCKACDDVSVERGLGALPTELPFTADDFDAQMEQAIELMEVLGDAEIEYAINGLLSR